MTRERYIQLVNLCYDVNINQETYTACINTFSISESINITNHKSKEIYEYFTHYISTDHTTRENIITYHWINDPNFDAAEAHLRSIIEGVTE